MTDKYTQLSHRFTHALCASMLLLSMPGCAKIKSQTREDYIPIGTEKQRLEPHYKPEYRAHLSRSERFDQAELLVQAHRKKTCRTQIIDVKERVLYTENTAENPAIIWAMALVGGSSVGCGVAQFTESPCFTEMSNDENDQKEPLSDGQIAGIGVGYLLVGAGALTSVIVDIARTSDDSEVLEVQRNPTHISEKACGSEPYQGAVVQIFGDDGEPYTTRTGPNGRVHIPLSELPLASVKAGESIGRIMVEKQEVEAVAFPTQWLRSKNEFYAQRLFEHAQSTDTPAAYLTYLQNFPEGENAALAHLKFQKSALREQAPAVLAIYLHEFGDHKLVKAQRRGLNQRLRIVQVERAYQAYTSAWESKGSADRPPFDEADADKALNARLYDFHHTRIAEMESQNSAFDALKAEYLGLIAVAPTDKKPSLRDILSELILKEATRLQSDSGAQGYAEIFGHYKRAATLAASPEMQRTVNTQALAFAMGVFEAALKEEKTRDEDFNAADHALEQAAPYAVEDESKKQLQAAHDALADRRAVFYLAQARQVLEDKPQPDHSPKAIQLFERAIQAARSEQVARQARAAYLEHFAALIRAWGEERASDPSTRTSIGLELHNQGLEHAKNTREADVIALAWIDACGDIAAYHAKQSSLRQLVQWKEWLNYAESFAMSSAAKKRAKKRRKEVERTLHKRYPPSKLDSTDQAVAVYPPTIAPSDSAGVRRALRAPKSHRGERIVVGIKITRVVGNKYMATSSSGQDLFVYSSNRLARSRLRVGDKAVVLGTIDGSISHKTSSGRQSLARINIVWATR